MSLQVWLPLNGNVNNQGLLNNEPTVTTGSSYDNGKIGKCLNNNGSAYVNINSDIVINGEFTIALWVKMNSMDTAWARVFGFRKNNNSYLGLCNDNNQTKLGFHIYDEVNGERKSIMDSYIFSPTINKWEHIAITYCDGVCNCYFNGTLLRSYNLEYTLNNTYSDNTLFSNYSGNNKNNCCINDFRFYDHALSPLEIKKLSQGLVAHWPLSMPGGENLCLRSKTFETGANYWSIASGWTKSVDSDGFTIINFSRTGATSRQWYRAIPHAYILAEDFDKGVTVSFDYMEDDVSAVDYGCIMAVQSFNASGKRVGWYESYFRENMNKTKPLEDGVWTRISQYVEPWVLRVHNSSAETVPDREITYSQITFQLVLNGSIHIKKVKIEFGDKTTPWIPASSDEEYSMMGFDNNIEYDVSGYGHNGIKSGVTYSSDTPRYYTSTYFDGQNSYIKILDNQWMIQGMPEITINTWICSEQFGRIFSCTEGGGFNIENSVTGYMRWQHNVYTNEEKTTGAYRYNNNAINISNLTSGWHMLTLVYNSTGEKIYIDGTLHSHYDFTSYGIRYNMNARLFLGCEANLADSSAPYLLGQLSDFRIYATAFSDDDVLSLYNTPISLSSNGTLLTQTEYSEV